MATDKMYQNQPDDSRMYRPKDEPKDYSGMYRNQGYDPKMYTNTGTTNSESKDKGMYTNTGDMYKNEAKKPAEKKRGGTITLKHCKVSTHEKHKGSKAW